LQLRRTFGQVDAGDGALAQTDAASALQVILAIPITVPIAGNQLGDELMEVGIVAYEQDTFAAGVLRNEVLQRGVVSVRRESGRSEDRGIEANLGGQELSRLAGALERAGDDDVDLSLEANQNSGHQHALLLAFFDKAAFGVENWIFTGNASVRMAHQV